MMVVTFTPLFTFVKKKATDLRTPCLSPLFIFGYNHCMDVNFRLTGSYNEHKASGFTLRAGSK